MSRESLRAEVRQSAASPRRISFGDRWRSYWAHHRSVALDSLRRVFHNPLGSLMTWLVIGIALALPGGLYIALHNLEQLSAGWDGSPQISLFLRGNSDDAAGRALAATVARRAGVAAADYLSPADALAEFRELSGFGEVIEHLDSNPLPAVILVQPDAGAGADSMRRLLEELKALPEVEQAVLDMEWVQRLYAMLAIGQRLALALALLLALGVLLVIGNTIRLAIESRRNEIVVVKLVGGTDAFVRRPFLYTGVWFGLGGGLIAWLILAAGVAWLGDPVAALAGLYQSEFALGGLSPGQVLALWLSGAALGWLGAWLAVSRHLGAIEPR
jgi:cell division transport system permease protein